ncbi:L,D-transpeptidase [Smaragdicoccus niigatensis]
MPRDTEVMRLLILRHVGLVGLLAVLAVTPGATASAEEIGQQLVVVNSANASDTTATLSTYDKVADGTWQRVLGPVKAYVGEVGMGEPQDGVPRTPVGDFALDIAFGRLVNPVTSMPYTQVTTQDWWDENPSSPTYNTMVHQSASPGGGSENLYNSGPVYDYAVNIAHNPNRIPGHTAGIFLHVTDGSPTLGCVAVDKNSMQNILKWLDPAKKPRILIGVGVAPPTAPVSTVGLAAPASPPAPVAADSAAPTGDLLSAIADSLLSGS